MITRLTSKATYALILMPQHKGMRHIRLTNNDAPVTLGRSIKTGITQIKISKEICSIRINSEGKVYLKMFHKLNKQHRFLLNDTPNKNNDYSDIFIRNKDALTLDSTFEVYKYKVHIIN